MNRVTYICLIAIAGLVMQACSGSKPTVKKEESVTPTTIVLTDKPLDTIKKYVEKQRWQVLYSIGGITGGDRNEFKELYYTFSGNGKMISEKEGEITEQKYSWKHKRDIYTGDSTYVLFTGLAGWSIDGIYRDTLRMADNHPDGYRYTLVKAD